MQLVSQFMHSPLDCNMEAVKKKILKLFKGILERNIFVFFSKHCHLQIEVYTNADWADSLMDRRSMMGYCTFVGSNLVTLRTKI